MRRAASHPPSSTCTWNPPSEAFPTKIVVVDNGSTDSTWQILQGEAAKIPTLRPIQNPASHGFRRAITQGLDSMAGDAMVIMMADESDGCRDVVRYWQTLNEGPDCVFGSRFLKHGGAIDYPPLKLALNRAANLFIRLLFRHGLNDTTNAFSATAAPAPPSSRSRKWAAATCRLTSQCKKLSYFS